MAEEKKSVDELLDRLLEGKAPEEILGNEGLLKELTKRLVERALEGEMTAHLGYEKHAVQGRNGSFEPQLAPKRRRRRAGFSARSPRSAASSQLRPPCVRFSTWRCRKHRSAGPCP